MAGRGINRCVARGAYPFVVEPKRSRVGRTVCALQRRPSLCAPASSAAIRVRTTMSDAAEHRRLVADELKELRQLVIGLERLSARMEGKVDAFIAQMRAQDDRTTDLEVRQRW